MNHKNLFLRCLLAFSVLFMLGACSPSETSKKTTLESTNVDSLIEDEKNNEVTLYVTRHGKTIFNTMHRVQGWSDTPLTEPGVEVAEYLGKGLRDVKFDAVYSSDSGRARETADIIIENAGQDNLVLQESINLREMHFGKYEGDFDENMWNPAAKKLGYDSQDELMKDLSEVGLEKVTQAMSENDETKEFESFKSVQQRMQNELKTISTEVKKNGGKNVLIVSHGMAISCMLSNLTEENVNRQLPNASISKVVIKDDQFIVESVGDESYILEGEKISKK